MEALTAALLEEQGLLGSPSKVGVERYEAPLRRAGLWPLPDLPSSMRSALAGPFMRNVVVHRGGFVDHSACG